MSTTSDTSKAAPPQTRRVRIEQVGADLELSYRRRCGCTALFLLLWLTGWSVGCVLLVGQALSDPGVRNILALCPFLASWVFVFAVVVGMFFGVEHLQLGPEGWEYRTTALVTLTRRRVPRAECKGVSASVTPYQVNDRHEPRLTFETMGQPLHFAAGISEEEQHWLAQWLNEYLDTLGTHDSPRRRPGTAVLQLETTPVEPPSDSRIEMRPHAETIAFVWQGEWSTSTIAGMTFLNLFWNGIVGLFLYQLNEAFEWSTCGFLIPFVVIGLVFCAAWLMTLTAPAWRLTWTFGEREITRHLSFSDPNAVVVEIGRSKRWELQPPLRIELRPLTPDPSPPRGEGSKNSPLSPRGRGVGGEGVKPSGSLWPLLSHPDGGHTLSFFDSRDREVLAINNLTEGDARWIADVLLRAFPSWSRREDKGSN